MKGRHGKNVDIVEASRVDAKPSSAVEVDVALLISAGYIQPFKEGYHTTKTDLEPKPRQHKTCVEGQEHRRRRFANTICSPPRQRRGYLTSRP
jgi:hypothetical protein